MRAVIQRVSEASVVVDGEVVGEIGHGYLMLVAVASGDTRSEADALVRKVVDLRVFADDDYRMNRSVRDVGGSILVVSQFTLAGSVKKGRRPSFTNAAPPDEAAPMVEYIAAAFADAGVPSATGRFGAMMDVSLVNDGPVTFVIDVADGTVA